jgi:hypothetical protein
MFDLLVLTNLDKHLFVLKIVHTLFHKTSYLKEEVCCTKPSLQLAFRGFKDIYY